MQAKWILLLGFFIQCFSLEMELMQNRTSQYPISLLPGWSYTLIIVGILIVGCISLGLIMMGLIVCDRIRRKKNTNPDGPDYHSIEMEQM